MKTLVEKYRNFNIYFDSELEIFMCDAKESGWNDKDAAKISKSFASVKGFIDEFVKDNANFESFIVKVSPDKVNHLGTSEPREMKIVGIRKDGRFVYEKSNGEKVQVSTWAESKYILYNSEDDIIFARIAILELEVDEVRQKLKDAQALIKSPTLESLKSKYIN
jgi:hypothetical protein